MHHRHLCLPLSDREQYVQCGAAWEICVESVLTVGNLCPSATQQTQEIKKLFALVKHCKLVCACVVGGGGYAV